jgi:5'(3')-deoxyribonucleotidase
MKNPEFVLAVDLDAVTGDHEEALRQFVANEYDLDPSTLPALSTWSMVAPGWPVRDELHNAELQRRAVLEGHIFRTMPEIEGASETLWELSDAGVYIRVVTSRLFNHWGHLAATTDTVAWLDAGPPGTTLPAGRRTFIPYRDLCFVSDKTQIGADMYVDDGPHNITALREQGVVVVVFNQLYNEQFDGPRALTWRAEQSVLDAVLAAKAEFDARQLAG